MFMQHGAAWWDLCCVLDLNGGSGNGYVYTPEEKRAEDAMALAAGVHIAPKLNTTSPQGVLDNKFIVGVISGIHHNLPEVSIQMLVPVFYCSRCQWIFKDVDTVCTSYYMSGYDY